MFKNINEISKKVTHPVGLSGWLSVDFSKCTGKSGLSFSFIFAYFKVGLYVIGQIG